MSCICRSPECKCAEWFLLTGAIPLRLGPNIKGYSDIGDIGDVGAECISNDYFNTRFTPVQYIQLSGEGKDFLLLNSNCWSIPRLRWPKCCLVHGGNPVSPPSILQVKFGHESWMTLYIGRGRISISDPLRDSSQHQLQLLHQPHKFKLVGQFVQLEASVQSWSLYPLKGIWSRPAWIVPGFRSSPSESGQQTADSLRDQNWQYLFLSQLRIRTLIPQWPHNNTAQYLLPMERGASLYVWYDGNATGAMDGTCCISVNPLANPLFACPRLGWPSDS